MDDGYRAVRAVIYRDIARVVVCVALLAAVVYVGSMRPQEWQLKALGVPFGVLKESGTTTIYRNGNQLSIIPRGGTAATAANVEFVSERRFYGRVTAPDFVADVYEAAGTTTTNVLYLNPEVTEAELAEFIRTNEALSRSVRMPGIGTYAPPSRAATRPARLGWVVWKYVKLPFWCGVAVLVFTLWLLRPRSPRMLRRASRGRCWKCGYDLDNAVPMCPECNAKAWAPTWRILLPRTVVAPVPTTPSTPD